jgi:hypothetical protein
VPPEIYKQINPHYTHLHAPLNPREADRGGPRARANGQLYRKVIERKLVTRKLIARDARFSVDRPAIGCVKKDITREEKDGEGLERIQGGCDCCVIWSSSIFSL